MLTPAVHVHLPAAPVRPFPVPADIEIQIGRLTGAVACMIAAGLQDLRVGRLQPDTKLTAAELLTRLILLRRDAAGEVDNFELVARTQGFQTLRQLCDADTSDAQITFLVDGALEIMHKVLRSLVN